MAKTVTPVIAPFVGERYARNCVTVTWAHCVTGDTLEAASIADFTDRSVQFAGTFGSATLTIVGSNDGANYVGLTDPSSTAISKTSAAIEGILEATAYIKPTISGGTGDDVTVTVFARKS